MEIQKNRGNYPAVFNLEKKYLNNVPNLENFALLLH